MRKALYNILTFLKSKILVYIFIFFCFFSINNCSTDFNIIADWKDITIVYGLLNQNDSIHYIKINKAFLGETNALLMAQNPDSSSYGNNLEVSLEEWSGGSKINAFYLDTTSIYNKEAGEFYYPNQIIYKTNAKLNPASTYKLVVYNKITKKVTSSQTQLIKPFSIEKPNALHQINFAGNSKMEAKWYSAQNGKFYQIIVRFHYSEKDLNTNTTEYNYIDWVIGSKISNNTKGGEVLTINYNGDGFFENLSHKIPVKNNIKRQEGKVEFIFLVAGEEFNTYMELNKPVSTIVQEKPQYTNIVNGLGVFSCRYDNRIINPIVLNLAARSSDSLKNGRFTHNLSF